jgi:hypothetical protein
MFRVKGSLVKWCGSFGFLKLDDQPEASNVFIHINEIRLVEKFEIIFLLFYFQQAQTTADYWYQAGGEIG